MTDKFNLSIANTKKGAIATKIISKLKQDERHGSVTDYILDAIIEKFERENPTKKSRRSSNEITARAPEIYKAEVDMLADIAKKRNSSNADTMRHVMSMYMRADTYQRLLTPHMEQIQQEMLGAVTSDDPDTELASFLRKYGLRMTDYGILKHDFDLKYSRGNLTRYLPGIS